LPSVFGRNRSRCATASISPQRAGCSSFDGRGTSPIRLGWSTVDASPADVESKADGELHPVRGAADGESSARQPVGGRAGDVVAQIQAQRQGRDEAPLDTATVIESHLVART